MKKVLLVIGVLLVVVVIAVVALPFLINANQFTPRVEQQLTQAIGRKVDIGNLRLSLFSGGVAAENVIIAEDPAFGTQPFVKAQSIKVGVEMMPLIMSRKINIRSLELNEPEVGLLRDENGRWNFSSIGQGKAPAETAGGQKPPAAQTGSEQAAGAPAADGGGGQDNISIAKININKGKLLVGRPGGKPYVYENVELSASDLSYTTQFPFQLTANTPGKGTLKVDGKAGPMNQTDASQTPLQAHVEIKNLDLATTGFIDPASGIAGILDYTGRLQSDGQTAKSDGTARLQHAKLVQNGKPATVPIDFEYASTYDLARQNLSLTQGLLKIGKAAAQILGTVNMRPNSPVIDARIDGQSMPVQQLEGVLPAIGVVLPPSASLQSGTANINLKLNGPIDRMVTTGTAALNNAKMANFDLGSKMKAVSALAGISVGKDTEIQQFSSQLRMAPEGIQANDLNLVVPTIGSLTGQGTIGANNALDFHLNVKPNQQSAVTGLTAAIGLNTAKSGIPVMVKGTTQDPKFLPDVGGLLKNQLGQGTGQANPAGNVGNVVEGLQGLFGKKKK